MTSNTIRAFALGLIVSSIIFGTVYNFFVKEELSLKEMVAILEENEYSVSKKTVVLEEEAKDAVQEVVEKEAETEKVTEATPPTETKAEPTPAPAPTMYSLTVISGMTPSDIGNWLQGYGIAGSKEFYNAVVASGKETKLKQGTFEIPSNATIPEIINIIFK